LSIAAHKPIWPQSPLETSISQLLIESVASSIQIIDLVAVTVSSSIVSKYYSNQQRNTYMKNQKTGVTRRAFMYLSGLAALALGKNIAAHESTSQLTTNSAANEWSEMLKEINDFPLFKALFNRRSRRFGWGMEIPHGPLQYKSNLPPTPIDDFERSVILAAGLGASGWHHGIPHTTPQEGLCNYSARYTGRTTPSAAGIGNSDLFFTQDDGTYYVSTRDAINEGNWCDTKLNSAESLVHVVRNHTRKLSDQRINPPRVAPHYSAHNFWNGNTEGSTLFIPVGNVSEQLLGLLFIAVGSGYTIFDDANGRPAGALQKFAQSGLIDLQKKYPLSYLEQYVLTTSAVEMGVMGHNMSLALQPLGLGGWFYSGINPFTMMGAYAAKGVPGLGFSFEKKDGWGVPNPLGIEGLYQAYSPPFYKNMRAAVESFLDLKFGANGGYNPNTAGPFQDNQEIKQQVSMPSEELIDAVVETSEYIYDTYGKFPGTVPSIFIRYYTQAHRLETGFYDKFFRENSYLGTHTRNVKRWLRKIRGEESVG
jgi:hypothetical protein